MQFIRSIRAAFAQALTTLSDLSAAIQSLRSAVEANTAATAEVKAALSRIEASAETTAQAVSYLHRAEQHRREQSGQRSKF